MINGSTPSLSAFTIIGVDFRSAPLALRERVAISDPVLPRALDHLRAIAPESLVLSTCNRTEIYAIVDGTDPAGELEQALAGFHGLARSEISGVTFAHRGEAAVGHLLEVASGLHSMMLGEPHILAQLRTALDASRAAGMLGPFLSRAGEVALRTGKRARTETSIGRGNSIPHATTAAVVVGLGEDLAGKKIVIAGAGQMAGHVARLLRSAGATDLVVLNRTAHHGEALAHAVGGRFAPLSQLQDELSDAAALISGISIPDRLLVDRVTLAGIPAQRSLLLIDLGVPRSIEPSLRDDARARLLDVDDLGAAAADHQSSRDADIVAIERMVDQEVAALIDWVDERAVATTIASLREQTEQIRVAELDRALRRLGTLSDRERNIVEALSVGLVGKLLHQPVTRLKSDRGDLAAAAQRLFGLQAPEPRFADTTGETH